MNDWAEEMGAKPQRNAAQRLRWWLAERLIGKSFGGYLQSTVRESDNLGPKQGKSRDFNPQIAVNNFFGLVYAAAQMNATAVARTPLRLYGRKRRGKTANFPMRSLKARSKNYLCGRLEQQPSRTVLTKALQFGEDFEEITEHPVLDTLRGVNKWFNAFDMTLLRILYLELTGNAYVYVREGQVARRSFPTELWPMPSQWVKVIPSNEQDSPIIKGYVYGRTDAEIETYGLDEVIRWNYPNPRNLYYGLGKVEAAWREICLRNSKSEHDQALFDNGARPDYVMVLKNAPAGEVARFQKEAEQRLRGTRNHGKFLAVNGEQASIVPLTFTAEQLGDQDRVIEAICNVFGVPVSKFMANKNVAGGQAGVSDASYLRDTVLPICRMDEEVLNADYLTRFDGAADDLMLAYDNPVPTDKEQERQDADMQLKHGLITRDEWRTENGRDAIGGNAETLLVPTGLIPIDEINAKPENGGDYPSDKTPKRGDSRDADSIDIDPEEDGKAKIIASLLESHQKTMDGVLSIVKTMSVAIDQRAADDSTNKQGKETHAKAVGDLIAGPRAADDDPKERQRRREREVLLTLLFAFFDWQRDSIFGAIDPVAHRPLSHNPEWDSRLATALFSDSLPTALRASQETMRRLAVSAERSGEVTTAITEKLQSVADRMARLINSTTLDRINLSISGVVEGAPNADDLLRAAMNRVFYDATDKRAFVIADDHVFLAEQIGNVTPGEIINRRANKPPEEKPVTATWFTAEDDRVCPTCGPLHGRTVIAGDEFAKGINLPVIDTHPKCRCEIVLGTEPVNYPPPEQPGGNP